jgi:hypothetical protein
LGVTRENKEDFTTTVVSNSGDMINVCGMKLANLLGSEKWDLIDCTKTITAANDEPIKHNILLTMFCQTSLLEKLFTWNQQAHNVMLGAATYLEKKRVI